MQETTLEAGGTSAPAEPVPSEPRATFLFQGEWVRNGGYVGKRGGFGVLQSRTGLTVMVDRRGVELLAFALGLVVVTPPVKLRTVCGWCKGLMFDGPRDAEGRGSTGCCDACAPLLRAGRTAELGR